MEKINKEAFDSIYGYDSLKKELLQVLDSMTDKERYKRFNVYPPQGLLLYGSPSVGKTMWVNAFAKLSGRKIFRMKKLSNDDNTVQNIISSFKEAILNQPSIVILDDINYFYDGYEHDSVYRTLANMIDKVRGLDVIYIGSENEKGELPDYLIRKGRFDYEIEIQNPNKELKIKMFKNCLKNVPVDNGVNLDDIVNLVSNNSTFCDIKDLISRTARIAAFRGSDKIFIIDFIRGYIDKDNEVDVYLPDALKQTEDEKDDAHNKAELEETCYSEAVQILVLEACVEGSINFAINLDDSDILNYDLEKINRRPFLILYYLSKIIANEILNGEQKMNNMWDLTYANSNVVDGIKDSGSCGIEYLVCEKEDPAAVYDTRTKEQKICGSYELQRFDKIARELIIKNSDFINATKKELLEARYIFPSKILSIKKEHPINRKPIESI